MSVTDLSGVLQPVETAHGLPNAHYISDEVFAQERHAVLFANWSSIGFAHDIPNPGDVTLRSTSQECRYLPCAPRPVTSKSIRTPVATGA